MRAASRKDAPLGQRVAKSLPPTHPTAEPQHRVAPPVPVAKPLPPTHPTAEPQHRVALPVPDHAAAAAAASPDAGAVAKGASGKRSAFSEVAVPLGKLESAKSFGGKASTDNSQLELGCAESPRVADGKAGEDPTPAKATSVVGSAERTQANEKILQPLQQPSSTPGQVKSPITVSESALVKKPKNGTSLDTEGKESQVTPPTNENIEPRDEDVKTTPIEVASKDKGKPVAAGNKISAESRDGDGEQSDGHRKSVSSKGEEKLEKHPKRATSPVRNGGKAADKKRSDGNSEQSGKLEERDNNAETRKLSSTNYGDEKNVKNPITLSPNLESKVHQPKSSNKTIEEATAGAGTRNLPKKLPGVEAMQIESKKTERVDMETDKSARTSDVVEKQPSTHGSAPTVSNEGGALKVLNREQFSPSHGSPGTDREREATGTNGKTPSPPLSSTIGGKQALGQSEKSSPTPSSSLEDGDKGTARKQKSPSKSLSPAVSDRGKAEKALERFVRTSGSKKPEDVAIRQVDQKSEKHRPQRKDAKVSSDKSDRKAGKVSGKERISKPSSYDTQSTEKSQGKENFKSGKSTKRKRRSEADKPTAEEPDQNPSGSPKKRPRIHNSDTRCVPQDLEEQKNILRALRELMEKDYAEVFLEPVDPSEKGCAAYYTVIKKAMDLGTIEKRLDQATSQNAYYAAKTDIFADIELVWSNCRQFNGMFDPIIGDVEKCMAFLDAALEKYGVESGANKDNQRRRSRSRSLKRKFEDSQLTERPKKQQQQRKKAKPKADDLNDGRLVGKVVAVFTRRGPRKAKAWTRVKVVDFLERSQSYKLQWLDDGKITYNATFGMNETFPVFRQ
ncbi:unnamed protein product [Chondrus crispus]|uniref:Bromo domain-containing protein n=1 Tax=Chondrus crispus TaxID=2769 RepID=R7QC78_CHOCR|nr:unnamed protein product [Chondrus crispus]CDF35001.1 unnamed protein product [Chondrus crispus]|eukprot:XP_005714820.1 unnamed protein product [Chondrus crispus]